MPSVGPFEVLILLFVVGLWLVPSYLVARFARDRGQNFWVFLLIGLVASWLLALIVTLLIPDRRQMPSVPMRAHDPDLQRLNDLADLHARGVITDAEFAAQKVAVLGPDRPAG